MKVFETTNNTRMLESWTEIKRFISGPSGSVNWVWSENSDSSYYQIITEPIIGYNHVFWMPKTGSAEQTDFEINYKNNVPYFYRNPIQQTTGSTTNGSAIVVAGVDSSNVVRDILTTTDGKQYIHGGQVVNAGLDFGNAVAVVGNDPVNNACRSLYVFPTGELVTTTLGQCFVNSPSSHYVDCAVIGSASIGSLVDVAIRQTTYTEQAAEAQRSINSTNANDTAAGTGARTVVINYVTTAGLYGTETVTLNGTTPVNTVNTNIRYINNMIVRSAGSTGASVGTIQLWTSTGGGGSVFASIAPNQLRTLYAHFYTLSTLGATAVTSFTVGASLSGRAQLKIRYAGESVETLIGGPTRVLANTSSQRRFQIPLIVGFGGPNRVTLYWSGVAATAAQVEGHIEMYQY